MSRQLRSITKALQSTAYHEAGHAVVAWLCDHDLGEVTICPDRHRGTLGNVQHNEEGSNELFEIDEIEPYADAPGGFVVRTGDQAGRHLTADERHWFELRERLSGQDIDEQHVMIAAAGEAAERRYSPESVEPEQSQDDWKSVFQSLERLTEKRGTLMEETRAKMIARATSLLDDPLVWRMVEAIANALLAKETLTPKEVRPEIRAVVIGRSVPT